MRTIVLYYSYSGHTKTIAEDFAKKESADIEEITEIKRPGRLKAFTSGCFAAMRGSMWPIKSLDADLVTYERLILLAPVWAGHPAPAVNSLLDRLPEGKEVYVKMVSASGKSDCINRLKTTIMGKGCTLVGFEDIKS